MLIPNIPTIPNTISTQAITSPRPALHTELMHSDDRLASESPTPMPNSPMSIQISAQIPINLMTIPKATTIPTIPSPTRPTSVKLKSPTTTPKLKPTKPQPTPERLAKTPEELARKIESYHRDAERICLAEYANDTLDENYYCPCLPNEFCMYQSYDFLFLFNWHL